MATFVYPESAQLTRIDKILLDKQIENSSAFKIFPVVTADDTLILWEQEDNFQGLMNVRGINGDSVKVNATGVKRFSMRPGYYGDYMEIDEEELLRRRQVGTFNAAISVEDLVMQRLAQLNTRMISRQEKMIWDLLVYGFFAYGGVNGAILHSDSYTQRTVSPLNGAWSNTSSSTPLADLRSWSLLSRGYSVRFDDSATLYLNKTTVNNMLNNTNSADLGGKRTNFGATFNSLAEVNKILLENYLPQVQVEEGGYQSEGQANNSGQWNLFVPNSTGVIVGKRTNGAPIGNFTFTRNANNHDMAPGPHVKVIDKFDDVPRLFRVHRGFNGGVKFAFPSAVLKVTGI